LKCIIAYILKTGPGFDRKQHFIHAENKAKMIWSEVVVAEIPDFEPLGFRLRGYRKNQG
jgi:hypothetical protein